VAFKERIPLYNTTSKVPKRQCNVHRKHPQYTHEAPKKRERKQGNERRGINNIVISEISEMIRTKRFESGEGSTGVRKTRRDAQNGTGG
jgi:hypothetical protein